MKIGGWKYRKESKELGSARLRVELAENASPIIESSDSFGTNCGLALSRPGLHLLTPVLNINCLVCSLLFFVVLSAGCIGLKLFHLGKDVRFGFIIISTFFICPDFVFLFFFRYRARLVGCLDCFFFPSFCTRGTCTRYWYISWDILISPLCFFYGIGRVSFFSAPFRLLHGICYSLLFGFVNGVFF